MPATRSRRFLYASPSKSLPDRGIRWYPETLNLAAYPEVSLSFPREGFRCAGILLR